MGFPDGATFSLGSLQGSEWVIDYAGDIASLATTPLTMTPPQDYNGAFTLAVEGEVIDMATLTTGAASDTTSITKLLAINVIPGNSAPEAVDDNYVTDEDHALNVGSLPGVIANDTDIDGDALTAALVTGASSGTLGLNADGSFSYRPNADFNGTNFSPIWPMTGGWIPNEATVTITVNAVNDAPTIDGDDGSSDFLVPGQSVFDPQLSTRRPLPEALR